MEQLQTTEPADTHWIPDILCTLSGSKLIPGTAVGLGASKPFGDKEGKAGGAGYGVWFYRSFFQNPNPTNAVNCLAGFSFISGRLIIATNKAKETAFNTAASIDTSCGRRCKCYMSKGKDTRRTRQHLYKQAELSATCDKTEMP